MAVKGIIFDLDGTLVDTLDDLTDSMNYGLKTLGFETRRPEECRTMIGNGLTKFAECALGKENQTQRDRLLEIMTTHYRRNCLNKTRIYKGLLEVVNVLRERGIRLAVLTNKNQYPAEKIVNHFFGQDVFYPIIGFLPGRAVKPEPCGVFETLGLWGLGSQDVVLAGDSEIDAQTAKRANIGFLACEWGFRRRQVLIDAGAKVLIQKPEEILMYLETDLPKGR